MQFRPVLAAGVAALILSVLMLVFAVRAEPRYIERWDPPLPEYVSVHRLGNCYLILVDKGTGKPKPAFSCNPKF